jgi:hypothetical protein
VKSFVVHLLKYEWNYSLEGFKILPDGYARSCCCSLKLFWKKTQILDQQTSSLKRMTLGKLRHFDNHSDYYLFRNLQKCSSILNRAGALEESRTYSFRTQGEHFKGTRAIINEHEQMFALSIEFFISL